MLFNSLTFLLFFLIILVLHHLPLRWSIKKANLLIGSYLFYAAWNPPFVVLLWISTIVDWFVAQWMARTESPAARWGLLLTSLGTNLGLLGFFKYGNFMLTNFVSIMDALGVHYRPLELNLILPVGISFYTFQTLSYTLDVYRGKARPWHSFLDYALFVTFFPQLVAGPIVRAVQFLPQCIQPRRATPTQLGWGFSLLTMGLFQKVILADHLMAPVADEVYGAAYKVGFLDAWVGTLAFSGQIFFDFAGYSTCAIGIALCLGFSLPHNFHFPYAAIGFSDFWRRWHISLSTWLRDYLYIGLGGNRKGHARTYVNLMLTMLLGGLWHGASWKFVVWGGLHGLYLLAERVVRRLWGQSSWVSRWYGKVFLALLTYYLVCITWVFFRAQDFSAGFALLTTMLTGLPGLRGSGAPATSLTVTLAWEQRIPVLAVSVAMLAGHWLLRDRGLEPAWCRLPWWVRALALAFLLFSLIQTPVGDRAFIYFQF